MDFLEKETLTRIIQSTTIAVVAFGLFFSLRGKILLLAQWAGLPRLALKPVRLTLRYSILIIATALILGMWGLPIGALLAFFGTVLGLIAIGFVAVWSVLSNFLCTFMLVIFKPFAIGDELELPTDNVKGRVTDITLLFTTLEVSPHETVVIPNNTFFQRIFKRRIGTATVELDYQLRQEKPISSVDIAPTQSA